MSERDCHVYVIAKRSGDTLIGPVKVGISASVEFRLRSIQTACPFPIDIAYVFECPNKEIARSLELSFHATQVNAKLHGEWFDFPPVHAIHLLCIGYRVLVEQTADRDLHEALLSKAGVQWAERRFGLNTPQTVLQ